MKQVLNAKAEKIGVVELLPDVAGDSLAIISLGPDCAFGEKITVDGVWYIEDCLNQFLSDLVTHLVQENKALTKLTINKGAKTATIGGSAFVRLAGAHKSMTWAGHPG